jgi:hypothetical protein
LVSPVSATPAGRHRRRRSPRPRPHGLDDDHRDEHHEHGADRRVEPIVEHEPPDLGDFFCRHLPGGELAGKLLGMRQEAALQVPVEDAGGCGHE